MGEHNNIVAPHLNAEVYRNDTKISNTMSYLDYIRIHADGTTLIGCSELTGRYWNGGARIYKSVRESNTIVRDAKVSVSLNSGTADGCFIQNSDKVLLGEDSGSLSVWGRGDNVWAQWEEQIIVSEHDDGILSIECLDPAKKYVTVGADANIKVWDIEELICETSYNAAHSMMITGVAVKPESSSTFATCSIDRHLTLWDTGSKGLVKDLATLSCGLRCLSWLDSHRLLIGDEAGALNVVDIRGEATPRELTIHPAPIHRIQKQPESNKVAVCCDNRIVTVYDVSDDNILQVSYKDCSMHDNSVRGLAWDPSDRNTLHTVGWDGTLRTHVMQN